ncbi:hypothetical protein ABT330_35300, partial [Streptomyces sp. NPDC000658]|uniref:hypothetical protein n=1 Tax=Streptomyces sp. NPDC000658 TaxID=3154266 RepID=UPI0033339B22
MLDNRGQRFGPRQPPAESSPAPRVTGDDRADGPRATRGAPARGPDVLWVSCGQRHGGRTGATTVAPRPR